MTTFLHLRSKIRSATLRHARPVAVPRPSHQQRRHRLHSAVDPETPWGQPPVSAKLCEAWQWKQANGRPRDMVCRGLLLMLHRAGEIELPPVRYTPPNPLAKRAQPVAMLIDTTPIHGRLSQLQPIEFQQVRRTAEEPLFNSLMEHHHYLGYEQPVGV